MQTAQQPAPSRFSEKQPTIHSLIFPIIKLIGVFVVFYIFFKVQGGKSGEDSLELFTSSPFLKGVATQAGCIAIGAIGLSIALAAGMLDLSVAGIAILAAAIANLYLQRNAPPADSPLHGDPMIIYVSIGIGVLTAGSTALLNAILCGLLRLPSAAASLAVFIAACAIGTLISSKTGALPQEFAGSLIQGTIPTQIIIAGALGLILQFIIRKTGFGIKLRACGANVNTARESGINIKAYGFIALLICGILAGLCGTTFWMAGSDFPSQGMEHMIILYMEILAAALLGGASVKGGYSQPLATVISSAVIALFFAGIALIDASPTVMQVTAGFVVLLCLLRNRMLKR